MFNKKRKNKRKQNKKPLQSRIMLVGVVRGSLGSPTEFCPQRVCYSALKSSEITGDGSPKAYDEAA